MQDKDGVIWPWDTARGFRDIGYNPLISGLAPLFIHTGMSLPTQVRAVLHCCTALLYCTMQHWHKILY
jgi:hypothetical protein